MKTRNFVSKHLRQFNRVQIEPNKKREQVSSRSACLEGENVSEGDKMPIEWVNELMFEVKTLCLSHEEE